MLNDLFAIGKRLGVGATAEVFLAHRYDSHEPRALKVFSPLVRSELEIVRRIQVETETLQTMRHPNIVRLFQSHAFGEELALELEYVDGSDLRRWRESYGLSLQEPLLWILSQIARGLGCAHENQILHRDLKPENVLVSTAGEVKLSDFGLARQLDAVTMTKSGLITGSMGYMAPELLDGQAPSPQSDLFSFGAVAYELLAGKNPFSGPNPQAVLKNLLGGKVRPLAECVAGVPAPILALIEQCLAPDPAARPKSIWHIEAELRLALGQTSVAKFCRELVSANDRGAATVAAFTEKKRELERRREELLRRTAEAPEWLGLARDWNHAFPDSGEPAAILGALPAPGSGRRKRLTLLALLLLLPLGAFIFLRRLPVSSPATALAPPASPATPLNPQAAAKTKPAPLGWIKVEADPDVQLFVDEKEVSAGQWNRIPAHPGRRRIKLFKEGFMPIENLITVRANEVSVVRARGGAL